MLFTSLCFWVQEMKYDTLSRLPTFPNFEICIHSVSSLHFQISKYAYTQ
uniref:Uncharacterized protein n=1 Tax=Arundo donax TaxID=35708 RepID=A0A0A8YLK1_ARUDO